MATDGKLFVTNKKALQVHFTSSKGKPVKANVKESELSAELMQKKKDAISQLHEVDVEFELAGGLPSNAGLLFDR